ncbi:MAG: hypothetical protein KAG64_00650 [Bacteroidales bacterium]|nr:hypothetical protein [Bacteroidales bacterium]
MKNLSLYSILLLLLLAVSCGVNKQKQDEDALYREVIFYYDDSITERVVWEYPEGNDSVILVSHFYKNSQLQMQGNISGGVRNGEWNAWDDQGRKLSTGNYIDGIENGLWTVWFPNGQKRYEGLFKDGKRQGLWVFFDDKGIKLKEIEY